MEFRLPELGEGVYEAEVVNWLVRPGDVVKRSQNVLEVLTDKATMEVPAPFAGTIDSLEVEPGQQIHVGQVILTYTPAGQKAEPAAAPAARAEAATAPVPLAPVPVESINGPSLVEHRPDLPVKAAPSVRYLAHKLGIDLARVRGTGPQGRILIGDLTPHLAPQARPPAIPPPDYGKPGTRIKMQGLRRRIAEHMVHSKHTIPHYTYVDECDVTELVRLRKELQENFAGAGVKLTYLAFFVKAVVGALKEVPLVNSSLDEAGGEIVLHDHYHVGIAVATPGGLIVPVIRDADRKDLPRIAQEIEQLSAAARAGKIRREDLQDGTFTVTSIGSIGGLFSTPVINHPEVAILGVGKIVPRPVFDEAGNVKSADMIYLSLSFDHRVVDGAVGTVFGNAIIRRLQKPAALLLPEKLL